MSATRGEQIAGVASMQLDARASSAPTARAMVRSILSDPLDQLTIATGLVVAVGLWALGLAHVVSREPLWLWVAALTGSLVVTFVGQIRWAAHATPLLAHIRIATQVIAITVIMDMTGWGPVLGTGYIVIVRELLIQIGPRYWRVLAAWSAAGCLGGSLAIAAHVAPTLLARPAVYGLAGLTGLATAWAIVLLGISGVQMETTGDSLQQSESKLRQTIETANEAYAEVDGRTGLISQWNERAVEIFGWTRPEAIGQHFGELLVPASLKTDYYQRLRYALDEGWSAGLRRREELILKHRDGHEFSVAFSCWPADTKDGRVLNIFMEDITERVRATQELQRSNDNFRLLFEQHPHPMWVYDQKTLRFLEVNAGATEQYGYSRDEFLAMTILDIRSEEDVPGLMRHLSQERPGLMRSGVWRHRKKDGASMDVEISSHVLDFNGRRGVLVMAQDVTERVHMEQQLRDHALHDPLTGLPNRALLLDRTEQLIAQARRADGTASVISINIDNFKLVNDAYGHGVGDGLLRAVGQRLSEAIRAVDTVGRIGGDEFVLLTAPPAIDAGPELMARRVLNLIRATPFRVEGHDLAVTASVGINPGMGRDGVELLRNADVALSVAKGEGGNRYAVFAAEMQAAMHERVALAIDLREADLNEQMETYYQPVIQLKDMKLVGMEALVRWRHPTRGLIAPAHFIPLAEEIGMISEVGSVVLRQACEQGARWQRRYKHLTVAVNVSVFQLRSEDFVLEVADALDRSHFNAANLILEITESVLINDPDTIAARLRSLKELGIRLAIDDFGTGYSSLSYLRQLPFDILKVDQSFLASVAESSETLAMLRTMVQLGRQLNLEIVAEGVEDEKQVELLQRLRCHNAQGYLFSRPLDADAAGAVIEAWSHPGRPAA
jgi:diguanylate cyclase (GGDEF)-like protein/PAS domain S-box-containing protein